MTALVDIVQRYRLPFIACNAGLLLLAAGTLVPIYQLLADRDTQIAEKQALLARFQVMAAREADIQAAGQPEGQPAHVEFLSGPNENVVSADLQARLKAIADRSRVKIRSIQSQPAKTSGTLLYVCAQLTIYGTLQHTQSAIYEIESSKPILFITNATIRLVASGASVNTPDEPTIEARLDVAGALPELGPKR
jgi:hypothetical protein